MRAVVTRVSSASVTIGGAVEGTIDRGFLILLGVGPSDTPAVCDKLAEKIRRNYGHVKPGLKTKAYFEVMRKLVKSGWNEVDVAYWKEHGWTEKARPWK